MEDNNMNEIEKQYLNIKKELLKLGFIIYGSVNTVYHRCGRSYCKCKKDKSKLHGPYYLWTWKEKGKTISKKLSLKQVEIFKMLKKNKKAFDLITERMKNLSRKYILSLKK